jgi:hypothetical protein
MVSCTSGLKVFKSLHSKGMDLCTHSRGQQCIVVPTCLQVAACPCTTHSLEVRQMMFAMQEFPMVFPPCAFVTRGGLTREV